MSDFLPIAVRAYTERLESEQPAPNLLRRSQTTSKTRKRAPNILVFDTETTTDASQRLTFGSYRYYRVRGGLELRAEGLFYADDLDSRDPGGLAVLRAYADTHGLRCLSRREFLEAVFFRAAYKLRATVVGFNLPFDLSRLAFAWGESRAPIARGFSLALWEWEDEGGAWHENRFRPRVVVKAIDSKRALKSFTRPLALDQADQIPEGSTSGEPDPRYTFRGHLLDLRTLAFALTDESHSLESACEAFDVEHGKETASEHGRITPAYIDYNRRDVEATAELYAKLIEEFERHPIVLDPTQAYSPASIGKAYLRAMGVKPFLKRQPDFPKEALGYAMCAYYGGRAECRIRRVPVPVVYCDFLSMYPTVNALMGLQDFLKAEGVDVVETTDEVRRFLADVTLEDCFKPETWKQLPVLVQVEPGNDILPVRADYEQRGGWQIGVNPLTYRYPLWYALADVVAAKVLSGRAPKVVRALRLTPEGTSSELRPVALRGEVTVDPRTDDFFQTVIEERKRLNSPFLKVLANSSSYGIYAEMRRRELAANQHDQVRGYGLEPVPFVTSVKAPEEPGVFAFPPLAACITAAARLMLTMLERSLADKAGTYAMCDTDAMAIVATNAGGLVECPGGPFRLQDGRGAIRALSTVEVEQIRARFAALNPYDQAVCPGSILELEKENFDPVNGEATQLYCLAISAKRYALFNLDGAGQPLLRKGSEHGLGHLLNPSDPESSDCTWMDQTWDLILCEALGLAAADPPWLDRPAVSRTTASSPAMLTPLLQDEEKVFADQVKPFNFLLAGHVRAFGHPIGVNPKRFHLVAPYTPDANEWLAKPWTDCHSGRPYGGTTTAEPTETQARLKSYRDVLTEYRMHPEPKSLGSDGSSRRGTRGLLVRRPVVAATVAYIGKESNRIEEVRAGLVHDPAEVLTQYQDPASDGWSQLTLPVLRRMPVRQVARAAGLHRRSVERIRAGVVPRAGTQAALSRTAVEFAGSALRRIGLEPARGDRSCLAAYLAAAQDGGELAKGSHWDRRA